MAGQPLSATITEALQYVTDLENLASPFATAADFLQVLKHPRNRDRTSFRIPVIALDRHLPCFLY
jgi:hypothetical protein